MSNKCQFVIDIKRVQHDILNLSWVLDNLKCDVLDTVNLENWIKDQGVFAVDIALDGLVLYVSWNLISSIQRMGFLAALRAIPWPGNHDQGQRPPPQEVEMMAFDYEGQQRVALLDRPQGVGPVPQQNIMAVNGHFPAKEYFFLLAAVVSNFKTFRYMNETLWVEDQLRNGVSKISGHLAQIRGGSSQMSVITMINRTRATILREDDACYKGSKVVDFDRLDPADNIKDLPTGVGVGIFATNSGYLSGSASAVVVQLYQGGQKLDRVVIAAADPINGRNTFLVKVNDDTKPYDLANENDTAGNGFDFTQPKTYDLPKVNSKLKVRVEEGSKAYKKYCHVIATFDQTGVVQAECREQVDEA